MPKTVFLEAILAGDRERATAEARRYLGRGLAFVYEQVVTPALIDVGERWERNEILVADEHVATELAQSAVAALYPEIHWPPRGPRALVACIVGERHDIGARMVADLLALDGWNEQFLGADTLVDKALALRPVLVALSVALPVRLPETRQTIAAVRSVLPETRILIGGRGMTASLASTLGADAFARSASEAVEVVRRWKPAAPTG